MFTWVGHRVILRVFLRIKKESATSTSRGPATPPRPHGFGSRCFRPAQRWRATAGQSTCWMRLRAGARRLSGSSPWSNSRLDLVQMLAPVVGAHGVKRAGLIQARKKFIRQRGHELVGLFRNAHRQLGQSAWSNRVDQRTRGVVDPVHVLGLVLGRRERLAALELAGEEERAAVPEGDV